VVRRDHHAGAALQGRAHVLDAVDLELDDLLIAAQRAVDQRTPQPHQPGLQSRVPGAGRCLKGLAVHGLCKKTGMDVV
jgi:hypothetical protein